MGTQTTPPPTVLHRGQHRLSLPPDLAAPGRARTTRRPHHHRPDPPAGTPAGGLTRPNTPPTGTKPTPGSGTRRPPGDTGVTDLPDIRKETENDLERLSGRNLGTARKIEVRDWMGCATRPSFPALRAVWNTQLRVLPRAFASAMASALLALFREGSSRAGQEDERNGRGVRYRPSCAHAGRVVGGGAHGRRF